MSDKEQTIEISLTEVSPDFSELNGDFSIGEPQTVIIKPTLKYRILSYLRFQRPPKPIVLDRVYLGSVTVGHEKGSRRVS